MRCIECSLEINKSRTAGTGVMAETGNPPDEPLGRCYMVRLYAMLAEQDQLMQRAQKLQSVYIAKLAEEYAEPLRQLLAEQKVPFDLEPEGIQDIFERAFSALEVAASRSGPLFVDELSKAELTNPAFKLGWVRSDAAPGGYVVTPTPAGVEALQGILNIRGQA